MDIIHDIHEDSHDTSHNVSLSWENPNIRKKLLHVSFGMGFNNDVADYIQKCDRCQRQYSWPPNVKNEMHSVPV